MKKFSQVDKFELDSFKVESLEQILLYVEYASSEDIKMASGKDEWVKKALIDSDF